MIGKRKKGAKKRGKEKVEVLRQELERETHLISTLSSDRAAGQSRRAKWVLLHQSRISQLLSPLPLPLGNVSSSSDDVAVIVIGTGAGDASAALALIKGSVGVDAVCYAAGGGGVEAVLFAEGEDKR